MRFATPRIVDFLVFLFLLTGPPKLRLRDPTASLRGEADAAVVLRLAVWIGGFVWLLARLYPVLVARGILPRGWAPQIIGTALLAVLSTAIWIAPGPALTTFSLFQLGVMLIFGWVFVRLYGPDTYLRYLFWGYLLLAVAVVVAWLLMPEMVLRRGRLRGDLVAPAGAVSALGLVICLSGVLRMKRWMFGLATGLFFVVLIASQTRTAYAAFFLFLLLGWMFRGSAPVKRLLPVAVVLLLVAALFELLPSGQQYVVREEQSLGTLSDRLPLWQHLIGTMLQESPVFGLGYFSASRVYGPEYNPGLGNAHSAFVEILVGGGLLGGLLFFTLYGALILYALKLFMNGRDNPMVLAVLGLFAVTFMMSLTNSEGIQPGPVGFTFWSLTALLPGVWEKLRADQWREEEEVRPTYGYARSAYS